MTDTKTPTDANPGLWLAVLADRHGDVYPTFAEAASVLPDDAEMMIRIVRDTALPVDDDTDDGLRLAQEYNVGDLAYETDAYLTDPDDESLGARVQYERAQAMADGLNYASELAALRAQVAYYEGPPKTPGRLALVPAAQRAPLYAAYRAAREWAEKNGQSYSDDGIIQAAVKAYRAELVTQAHTAAEDAEKAETTAVPS